ncbi:MAG: hypothetical protein JNM56_08880 [Planctomycetia bacterium]|nr:hypothetical protein [Planctomycetia bacterium]
MIDTETYETVLQAERAQLQAALTDLQGMRRLAPPAEPPGRSLFEYVPVSFLQSVDWQGVDEVPGPTGASQFDFRLAPPRPRESAGRAVEAAGDAAEPSEPPIERVGGFFEAFDLQDPVEASGALTGCEERAPETVAGGLEFEDVEENSPAPPQELPVATVEDPARATDPDDQTTAGSAFNSFSWE